MASASTNPTPTNPYSAPRGVYDIGSQRPLILVISMFLFMAWSGLQFLNSIYSLFIILYFNVLTAQASDEVLSDVWVDREGVKTMIAPVNLYVVIETVLRFVTFIAAIKLLRWKKKGFWWVNASSGILFAASLCLGYDLIEASVDLIGVAILAGLFIRYRSTAWLQLA